jgi:AbrB family looped-hinge helix DNA binding protein
MSSPEATDETTVNDSHSVTVPSEIRDRLDIEPGDKLRWTLGEDGKLRVEVVRQRYGAFADLEPIDIGEETDAVEETEEHAYEGV